MSRQLEIMRPRVALASGTRARILARDNHTCRYCGKTGHADEIFADHVIAAGRGGSNEDSNLVASCLRCNLLKTAHPAGFMIEQAPEHLQRWWREFLTNPPETPLPEDKALEFTPEQRAEISRVMSELGSRKSAAKTEASRVSVVKAQAARRKNPLDAICICTGGESLQASDHKTTCPRGRLLWQRERAAAAKAQKKVAA
jgi:hypothetical protein